MNTFTGALDDNRAEQDKLKDWKADAFIDWDKVALGDNFPELGFNDLAILKIPEFKVRNQAQSGTCVAQTLAMMMSIEVYRETGVWHDFSASFIYNRRSNKGGGMIGFNALELNKDLGALFESLMPSQNMSEADIAKVKEHPHFKRLAKAFAGLGFAFVPFDIDKMAYINSSVKNGLHKPLMTWYRFPRAEWTAQPKISSSNNDLVHHSVTGLQAGKLKGEKGMFTLDSWGHNRTTNNGFRHISEKYLPRMTFCAYVDDFSKIWNGNPLVPDVEKPKVFISEHLRFGSKGENVKKLQRVLKYEELIPQKTIIDGIFGAVTLSGVKAFQKKYKLLVDGVTGPQTIKMLNLLYS